jgi:hypothetical protein
LSAILATTVNVAFWPFPALCRRPSSVSSLKRPTMIPMENYCVVLLERIKPIQQISAPASQPHEKSKSKFSNPAKLSGFSKLHI